MNYSLIHYEHHSQLVDNNEFFFEYQSSHYHWRYDSNFFLLKFQPYLQEFKLIEEMQMAAHHNQQMNHLKFIWPQDTPLTSEVVKYLDQQSYLLEYLELYTISPEKFKSRTSNSSITLEKVNEEKLGIFKSFNYPKDKEVSDEFAHYKLGFYDELEENERFKLFYARVNGQVAGSLIAIENENTIEIDDLYTHKDFRHQSVASTLQQAVMDLALELGKDVILIADGEDTIKDMYKKQGYQLLGYHIGAIKEL